MRRLVVRLLAVAVVSAVVGALVVLAVHDRDASWAVAVASIVSAGATIALVVITARYVSLTHALVEEARAARLAEQQRWETGRLQDAFRPVEIVFEWVDQFLDTRTTRPEEKPIFRAKITVTNGTVHTLNDYRGWGLMDDDSRREVSRGMVAFYLQPGESIEIPIELGRRWRWRDHRPPAAVFGISLAFDGQRIMLDGDSRTTVLE